MEKTSFVYRSIFVYRLVMNVLYRGRYKDRFEPVLSFISALPRGARILELCFGDICIARHCRENGYQWHGMDINLRFVRLAQELGYDAEIADLMTRKQLPTANACVIMGSLYHFHTHAQAILAKMLKAAPIVIVSEPIRNLSGRPGLIGMLARKSANAGRGNEVFRYNKHSLLSFLENEQAALGFKISDIFEHGRDLIVKLTRDEKH